MRAKRSMTGDRMARARAADSTRGARDASSGRRWPSGRRGSSGTWISTWRALVRKRGRTCTSTRPARMPCGIDCIDRCRSIRVVDPTRRVAPGVSVAPAGGRCAPARRDGLAGCRSRTVISPSPTLRTQCARETPGSSSLTEHDVDLPTTCSPRPRETVRPAPGPPTIRRSASPTEPDGIRERCGGAATTTAPLRSGGAPRAESSPSGLSSTVNWTSSSWPSPLGSRSIRWPSSRRSSPKVESSGASTRTSAGPRPEAGRLSMRLRRSRTSWAPSVPR